MGVGSTVAKNAILDAQWGDGRASGIPASFYLAFFNGDPLGAGTELTSTGGYTRTLVANTNAVWNAAASGQKRNAVAILSGASTGAFSAQITHVAFMDALSGGNMWDAGPLDTPLTVSAANTTVRFQANALTLAVA